MIFHVPVERTEKTYTARGLYSKQRSVFVNFFTTWSNMNTTFHYRVKIATPGLEFYNDLVEHKHYYFLLPGLK